MTEKYGKWVIASLITLGVFGMILLPLASMGEDADADGFLSGDDMLSEPEDEQSGQHPYYQTQSANLKATQAAKESTFQNYFSKRTGELLTGIKERDEERSEEIKDKTDGLTGGMKDAADWKDVMKLIRASVEKEKEKQNSLFKVIVTEGRKIHRREILDLAFNTVWSRSVVRGKGVTDDLREMAIGATMGGLQSALTNEIPIFEGRTLTDEMRRKDAVLTKDDVTAYLRKNVELTKAAAFPLSNGEVAYVVEIRMSLNALTDLEKKVTASRKRVEEVPVQFTPVPPTRIRSTRIPPTPIPIRTKAPEPTKPGTERTRVPERPTPAPANQPTPPPVTDISYNRIGNGPVTALVVDASNADFTYRRDFDLCCSFGRLYSRVGGKGQSVVAQMDKDFVQWRFDMDEVREELDDNYLLAGAVNAPADSRNDLWISNDAAFMVMSTNNQFNYLRENLVYVVVAE